MKFIEAEFRRRQLKRLGNPTSPGTESDGLDMYAALINNPEFTNILMNLLAQKGLDAGDSETSAQLLDLLKSNPEFLKSFLSNAPQPDAGLEPSTSAQSTLQQSSAFYDPSMGLDSSQLFAATAPQTFQFATALEQHTPEPPPEASAPVIEVPVQEAPVVEAAVVEAPVIEAKVTESVQIIGPETVQMLPTVTTPTPPPQPSPLLSNPAPIPRLGPVVEGEGSPVRQTSIPAPSYGAIPMPAVYIPPSAATARPVPPASEERVRALGFPPRMGHR